MLPVNQVGLFFIHSLGHSLYYGLAEWAPQLKKTNTAKLNILQTTTATVQIPQMTTDISVSGGHERTDGGCI